MFQSSKDREERGGEGRGREGWGGVGRGGERKYIPYTKYKDINNTSEMTSFKTVWSTESMRFGIKESQT